MTAFPVMTGTGTGKPGRKKKNHQPVAKRRETDDKIPIIGLNRHYRDGGTVSRQRYCLLENIVNGKSLIFYR
jgi:hypothetical protein